VNEFGAEFHRDRGIRLGERVDATANPIACFDDTHSLAALGQCCRCGKPGGTSSDHDHIEGRGIFSLCHG
jgi:hypothetical protein